MSHLFGVFNRRWAGFTGLVVFLLLLTACGLSPEPPLPGAVVRTETVSLPTAVPTSKASPVSTRVMPLEVLTPPATPTITPIPEEALGLVADVLDGETIMVVLDGDPAGLAYRVRYIGIDAPPNSSTDPWGVVAYETNQKLTNLKVVRLVRDETDFDDEGNLLRHVYVGNQLVSLLLVQQGLARVDSIEPNLALETELKAAEVQANQANLGIWSNQPPTPTPSQVVTGTTTAPVTPTPEAAPETTLTPEAEGTEVEPGEAETPEVEPTETEPTETTEAPATEAITPTVTRTTTPEPTEEATPESP